MLVELMSTKMMAMETIPACFAFTAVVPVMATETLGTSVDFPCDPTSTCVFVDITVAVSVCYSTRSAVSLFFDTAVVAVEAFNVIFSAESQMSTTSLCCV
jgi:hypothetical protein